MAYPGTWYSSVGAGRAKETDLPPHPPLPFSQLYPSGSPAINLKTFIFNVTRPDTDHALQFVDQPPCCSVDCHGWWPLHNGPQRASYCTKCAPRHKRASRVNPLSTPVRCFDVHDPATAVHLVLDHGTYIASILHAHYYMHIFPISGDTTLWFEL